MRKMLGMTNEYDAIAGQRCKDNEGKATIIKPMREIDTEVAALLGQTKN